MLGDGGYDGEMSSSTAGLDDGYATANTDSGHSVEEFAGAAFAFDRPDFDGARAREKDYGYRAVHLTVRSAKKIIKRYYGKRPSYSYFNGCSTGGRQAHMEVQRYPDDFDGVVDGAAAFCLTGLAVEQNWSLQQTFAAEIGAKVPLLAKSVMARCDGIDSLVDGLIDDPRNRDFDPTELQCVAGADPQTCGFTFDFANFLFFKYDPGALDEYDWREFDFETDPQADRFMARLLNATDPDISEFAGRDRGRGHGRGFGLHEGSNSHARRQGGKYILYHGWADGLIPPFRTVEHYEDVIAHNYGDLDDTQQFARLFMVPGMDHCGSPPGGLFVSDWLTPLVNWVENGIAPDRIIATQTVGLDNPRTRPLCPYPEVARYKGSGDTDDSASFQCTVP